MRLLFTLFLIYFFCLASFSQVVIQGKIKDTLGNFLSGVTVSEKNGKAKSLSASDGNFSIIIQDQDHVLIFSAVGFDTKEVNPGKEEFLNIILTESNGSLHEVVITALGIRRNRRQLGYSVQTVRSGDLKEVRQTNLVNALAGRVAGVQVTNGSSGIGSSSRIVIRGETSLSGINQPLFVIDGVPISNTIITNNTENNETGFQEVDYGNGAADINPDDIESITILKGAGAAALYGSRAAGGVVVIKTKDGTSPQKSAISFNSSATWENPLRLPDYQNVYGAGAGGKFLYEDGFGAGVNDGGLTSFGPLLNGQLIKQFNGPSTDGMGNPVRGADIFARNGNPIQPTPFIAQPDNVKDFFETGRTLINHVAFTGGAGKTSLRLSYTNLANKGITPNTDLKRNSFVLSGSTEIIPKLIARAFVNFIKSSSNNRPAVGYGSENPIYTFNWTGRQVNIADLKNYWQAGKKDFNQFNSNYLWLDNPYFTAYENTNGFDKNRLVGNASLQYNFNNAINVRFRTGIDNYHDLRKSKRAFSTKRFISGAYREDEISYSEINTDLLFSYAKVVSPDLNISFSGGGNVLRQQSNYKSTIANQLSVPRIYNFGNTKVPLLTSQEEADKQINSLYGLANAGYRQFLFMDVTIRNDWSSTLPVNHNSYAYYSASGSFIVSEITRLPVWINYAKLRLSYAKVGGDTDPYQLNNTFVFNQNYGATPLLTNSTRFLNPGLTPEKSATIEAGTEIFLFKNKLGVDISIYQNTNSDQIINLPASAASGYTTRVVNGGKIRSRGIEITLNTENKFSKNFEWKSFINFSQNRSRVLSLPQGVDQYVTGFESLYASTDNSVFFIATPTNGGRVGDLYGTGLLQVDGKNVYDSKGFPVRDGQLKNLGNYNPDFMLGFGNEFSYKNFNLNFLWDWRQGGVFLSRTFSLGNTSGILASTLPGREKGIIGDGITNTGLATNPHYEINTKSIAASDYYGQYYNRANEATSIFDASFVKLRQVALSYDLPKSWTRRITANNMRVGFICNNVLLFTKNPNVDPEVNAVQGRKYVYGVDDMSLPSSRSYGINININF